MAKLYCPQWKHFWITVSPILIALCVLIGMARAADEPKPPTIPAELQTEIALTQLDAAVAREANDKAQALAQSAIAKGQAACGDKYVLTRAGTKLECVAKPVVPQAEAPLP